MELFIPVEYIIYTVCLMGAVYTTWRTAFSHGAYSVLDQLERQGLITFAEEDNIDEE